VTPLKCSNFFLPGKQIPNPAILRILKDEGLGLLSMAKSGFIGQRFMHSKIQGAISHKLLWLKTN
jgi:hypothetical protein